MNMRSATDISADYAVTPGPDLVELIREHARAQIPLMLWGPPGIGKSHIAVQAAQALYWVNGEIQMPWNYLDVRALTMEPIDLRGVMYRPNAGLILLTRENGDQFAVNPSRIDLIEPDKTAGAMLYLSGKQGTLWVKETVAEIMAMLNVDETRYARPSFLPPSESTESYLINFDELPSALPAMQASLYQLIQERRVGDYRLPKGASMIACGNRETDRGMVHKMLSPLASRFCHVDVGAPNANVWRQWALLAGIRPEVFSFIRFRPDWLHKFDPELYAQAADTSGERAFPCPRTWEIVSDALNKCTLNGPNLKATVRGLVGAAAEGMFTAFLKVYQGIPMPEDILADPQRAPIPDRSNPAQQWAVCGSVAHVVKDTTMPSFVTYAKRLRPELGEYMVDCAVRRDASLRYGQPWIEWETWIERQKPAT